MTKAKVNNTQYFNSLYCKDTSKRYHIVNTTTNNVLSTSDKLMFINQRFININKRKNSTIILLDTATGEILKSK